MNLQKVLQELYGNRKRREVTDISEIRELLANDGERCANCGFIEHNGEKHGYLLGKTPTLCYGDNGVILYCSLTNYLTAFDHNVSKNLEQRIAKLENDKTELFVLVSRLLSLMGSFGGGENNIFAFPIKESLDLLERLNEN